MLQTFEGFVTREGLNMKKDICPICGMGKIVDGECPVCGMCYTGDEYDQSIKTDAGKLRFTLVPRQIIYGIAQVREYGVDKYGNNDSWKRVEVERYRDAAFRHWFAYLDDPAGVDAESGLPHLWHLACNIAFLCELEK